MAQALETDHVDRWLETVQQELPSLDVAIEGIVDRVMGISRRLKRMLDETLAEHGLNYGEWSVLASLRFAPGRCLPAGGCARKAEVSSAAMTNRLDRLEGAGFVRRVSDPDDRRSVLVELTPLGRDVYERAVETQAAKEAIVAAALDDEDKETLNALLRRVMLEFERRERTKNA